jgi:hypothetical protein
MKIFIIVHFYQHTKQLMIDSIPLCPVFKGAKTNEQQSGEKGTPTVPTLRAYLRFSFLTGR